MRVLLTSIGKGNYEETTYYFDQDESRTRFAGVAIEAIFGPFDKIVIVVTPESDKLIERYPTEFDPIKHKFSKLQIETPNDDTSQNLVIGRLIDEIAPDQGQPDTMSVTIDITHAFRSLPVLLLSATAFLTRFRGVEIEDVLYGAFEHKDRTPIVSLKTAYDLIEWSSAVTLFMETGQTRGLESLINRLNRPRSDADKKPISQTLDSFKKALDGFSVIVGASLPIEVGARARSVLDALNGLSEDSRRFPVLGKIVEELRSEMEKIALPSGTKRESLRLDRDELRRELNFARWALENSQLTNALTMLSELQTNWCLINEGRADRWFVQQDREDVAHRLAALGSLCANKELRNCVDEGLARVAEIRQKIQTARNQIAHCGFKEEVHEPKDLKMTVVSAVKELEQLIEESIPVQIPAIHCLLVSPLGVRPGALYTAIKHKKPDRVLAIVSSDSLRHLEITVRKAGMDMRNVEYITMQDPHMGYSEIKEILNKVTRQLVESGDIVVNVTGGTTVMGEAALQIHLMAQRM
ncbi:MAG: TM1812 family CRISPR-associated protein, partial [Candidatus Thorarchaeota archaeon]